MVSTIECIWHMDPKSVDAMWAHAEAHAVNSPIRFVDQDNLIAWLQSGLPPDWRVSPGTVRYDMRRDFENEEHTLVFVAEIP